VWARANLARLRQVLRALVDNALKHTPAGGRVALEAAARGQWAVVRVADTGEGIAAEHLPRVERRFYRIDVVRPRAPGSVGAGAGLGLSIASELIRHMRGELRIDSQPGRGTTATVRLPLASRG
jgi:signal transduction histidine kinase